MWPIWESNGYWTFYESIKFDFSKTGEYEIQLGIATDVNDWKYSNVILVNVISPVSLSATPSEGPAPLTVNFTCSVDGVDPDLVKTYFYSWDFDIQNGDDVDASGTGLMETSNTYEAGVYTASVTVTDAEGNPVGTAAVSVEIKVRSESTTSYDDGYSAGVAYCQIHPEVCGIQGAILDTEQLHFFIPRFESDHSEALFSGYKNFSFIKMGSDDIKNEIALQQFSSEEDATMIWMLTDYELAGDDTAGGGEYLREDESLQYMDGFYDAM